MCTFESQQMKPEGDGDKCLVFTCITLVHLRKTILALCDHKPWWIFTFALNLSIRRNTPYHSNHLFSLGLSPHQCQYGRSFINTMISLHRAGAGKVLRHA